MKRSALDIAVGVFVILGILALGWLSIRLDNFQARVYMALDKNVKLTEDSIASIKTKGLIGEKFLQISPGGSDRIIKPNGKITEVEPPVDLEELLSKYVFGKV